MQFDHKTENGNIVLAYFRYVDIVTGEAICESINGELFWYREPDNDFIKSVVCHRFEEIQQKWWLEAHGIGQSFAQPEMNSATKEFFDAVNRCKVGKPSLESTE